MHLINELRINPLATVAQDLEQIVQQLLGWRFKSQSVVESLRKKHNPEVLPTGLDKFRFSKKKQHYFQLSN